MASTALLNLGSLTRWFVRLHALRDEACSQSWVGRRASKPPPPYRGSLKHSRLAAELLIHPYAKQAFLVERYLGGMF